MTVSEDKRTGRVVSALESGWGRDGVRMYDCGTRHVFDDLPGLDDPVGHEEHSTICVDLHSREANVVERVSFPGASGKQAVYPLLAEKAVEWLRLYLTERQVETDRELTQAVDRLSRVIARRKGLRRRRLLRKSTNRRAGT